MGRIACALLARPALWPEAVRAVRRLAPRRWWARRPHLPFPGDDYVRFRTVTNRGGDGGGDGRDGAAAPGLLAEDVVYYLKWCRSMRRVLE